MPESTEACPACGGRTRKERPYLLGVAPALIYFVVPVFMLFLVDRLGSEVVMAVGLAWLIAVSPLVVACLLPSGFRFLWLGPRTCESCGWFRLGARGAKALRRTRRTGSGLTGAAAVLLGLAGAALWIFALSEYVQTRDLKRPTDAILAAGLLYGALGFAALRPAFRPERGFRMWGGE